jgi:uncharacterized protein with LGFP repeats
MLETTSIASTAMSASAAAAASLRSTPTIAPVSQEEPMEAVEQGLASAEVPLAPQLPPLLVPTFLTPEQ